MAFAIVVQRISRRRMPHSRDRLNPLAHQSHPER